MITKQLKRMRFDWDGKNMTLGYPGNQFVLNRIYLLSLVRFAIRCLTRKNKKI